MKKFLLPLFILILLALDWAAFNDISQGEPQVFEEYAVIVGSIVVFMLILVWRLLHQTKQKK